MVENLPHSIAALLGEEPLWKERFLGGSPDRERELFAGFGRDIKRLQRAVERRSKSGRIMRAFHAKTVLGVRGELRVDPNLAPELRVGFFEQAEPLPVTIRFSASSHAVKADKKRNGRGIALRIEDSSRFYDLLFSDSPSSHARDAEQFMAFVRFLGAPWWPVPLLRELGLRESLRLGRGLLAQTYWLKPALSATRFWGKTPMLLNRQAVKYQLVPLDALARPPGACGESFMREDLIARIDAEDVRYALCIQRFVDEQRTPIEDHSVAWRETDAPLEKVAELVIARKAFQTQPPGLEAEIERMAFNPWNTTPTLRPLGSLNRARKLVYTASADQRERAGAQGRLDRLIGRFEEPLLDALSAGFKQLNKVVHWHRLPAMLGTINLVALRHGMRRTNLHDVDDMFEPLAPAAPAESRRSQDGGRNDVQFPRMGSVGRAFGRNVPRAHALPESAPNLVTPSPREVSLRLLARGGRPFVPAESLNLLAAGWIQFQVHDWFAHDQEHGHGEIEIPLAEGDPWRGGCPMRVPRTPRAERSDAEREHKLPPTYHNQTSHWWDGSQIYGDKAALGASLRVPGRAELELTDAGLLPRGPDGLPITGSNQNWWSGLELMHTLFAREHNTICRMLRSQYPAWPEDTIFDTARLINVALLAKIHTTEWTPAVLAHPTLQLSMNAHWWGLLGERFHRRFGRLSKGEIFGGIPGSPREHFEVPFALTEEFVSVYRLHPMLPDVLTLRSLTQAGQREIPLTETTFDASRGLIETCGLGSLLYSFGTMHPGAMCLHNYPNFMTELESPDEPLRDVGAIDILRDRERGIPRYNDFRKAMGMPKVSSYEELTGKNQELIKELSALYGEDGIDRVDLLVGSLAEKPPPGFGFSDTTFRVFVLMASRRLKSDRFFTDDYNEQTYTAEGLAWVRDNTMLSVLRRHFPELRSALRNVKNAFAPWQVVH